MWIATSMNSTSNSNLHELESSLSTTKELFNMNTRWNELDSSSNLSNTNIREEVSSQSVSQIFRNRNEELSQLVLTSSAAADGLTSTESNEDVADWTTLWQYQRGAAILMYGSPILITMATLGNLASVVILQHTLFRKSSTSFILSVMAFVDTLVVNVGLIRLWINCLFNIDVRNFTSFGCKLHEFLTYCTPMVINYLFRFRLLQF